LSISANNKIQPNEYKKIIFFPNFSTDSEKNIGTMTSTPQQTQLTPKQVEALAPSIATLLINEPRVFNGNTDHRRIRVACSPQEVVAWRIVVENPHPFPAQHQSLLAAIVKALAAAANQPFFENADPSVSRLNTPFSERSQREIAPFIRVQVSPSPNVADGDTDGLFLHVSLDFSSPSVYNDNGPLCGVPAYLKPGNGDAPAPFAPEALFHFASQPSIERVGGYEDNEKQKATVVWTLRHDNNKRWDDVYLFENLKLVILILQHFSMTPSQIAQTMFPHMVGPEKNARYRPGSVTLVQKPIKNRQSGLFTDIATTIKIEVRETPSTTAIINEALKAFHRMVDELPSVQNQTRKRKVDEMVQDADLQTVESGDDVYIHYPPVKRQSSED